jgi:hypothetical protein
MTVGEFLLAVVLGVERKMWKDDDKEVRPWWEEAFKVRRSGWATMM